MTNEASRREFFKRLVLGGTGLYLSPLLLQSCSSEDLGRPPFGVWEDMIRVLEQSPDHLIGKRKALILSKDPKAMTDFVRDSFQVLPAERDFFRQIAHDTRYGTKMALRCGLATPREKAEILKNMLVEAGFEAKVILERTSISLEEAKNIAFNNHFPEFDPPISKSKIRSWHKALGTTKTEGNVEIIPEFKEKSEALANDLLEGIDEKYIREASVNQGFHENGVPSVAFYENGEEKYAHVFDQAVPFGQLHPTNTEQDFNDATEIKVPKDQEITISLSCRNAMDKWNETELVSGTWKLSELLGSQLQVQFLNNMTFEDQAIKSISQITNFTPCLSLQNIYKDILYMEERSFMGEPITLEGEKVLERYNPTILPTEALGLAVKKIHSFDGKVQPQAFPKVKLELEPKDIEGNIIEGLSVSNFEIVDNGEVRTGWLKQNSISPKILLLYDTSLSMPVEYRGEGIKTFLKNTEENIKEAYPTAQVLLQETGSSIYTALLGAKQLDVDLILYATDGHNNDQYDASYQAIYDSGPPAIFLNVFSQESIYKHIRENMDIEEIPAEDQDQTIKDIKKYIGQLKFPTYVLTYHTSGEDKQHDVIVKIKDTEHQIKLNYKFSHNDHVLGNRIIGLYLTLGGRGIRPIKRVLAGYEPHLDHYVNPTRPNRSMIDEVHEMVLGGAVMAFEREAPTLSLQLTEYLKTLMGNKAWFEAYQDNDIDKALQELNKGNLTYPPILLTMLQPLQDNITRDAITYPNGFRTCLIKCIPGYYNKKSKISFDYLPTSDYLSVTRSGKGSFIETLKKTAQLAILEAYMFENSAYSQLQGKPLLLDKEKGRDERFSTKALGKDYPYYSKLVFGGSGLKIFDTSLQTKSFWRIDPIKGELYGILPDQTGGGSKTVEEQLQGLQTVVQEYSKLVAQMNLAMTVTGVGTMPIGIVAAYSLTLVKLYALASEALILMDAGGMDDKINEALADLACDIYKEILYVGMGRLGTGASTIENLIGSMGGSYSFVSC
ncbi:MAG: hypothetical protein NXH90_11105 [Flavobacteriaceae bacterium]|nr:hypothetical protein [Flavobacteriaceae bacterium]